jgi:hypothetical protein
MDRVLNRRTTWFLVNIKAREEQTEEHYVRVFRRLYDEDPMIEFPRGKSGSLKSIELSEIKDENDEPQWIQINLLSYTIIDPDAFYNRRNRENVYMEDWDNDIVANKKETEMYFIPSVHTLVVRCNAEISLKNVLRYFSTALNIIEPDMFDVDVIVQRDILERIINAHLVTHLYANISFSNPGHTHGFEAAFDDKLREMGAGRVEFIAKGSQEHPLNKNEDGMLQAIVNISERNGFVKATIQQTENSGLEKIDSSEHPRKLLIPQIINDIRTTIYNTIRSIIH